MKNSLKGVHQLPEFLRDIAETPFIEDVRCGFQRTPMSVRLTPYILSLIDWESPWEDPLRRQFLPLASEWEEPHPMCSLDSLGEKNDEVAPGLIHRYADKVLFLVLDVCPVYCRFCTRSYAVGSDTQEVEKNSFKPQRHRWDQGLRYLEENDEVEDVVLSGGDLFMLPAKHLQFLLERLLSIKHIRRIRIATKGLAVLHQKVLSDAGWLAVVATMSERARSQGVQICVHTHFNHPSEITRHSALASDAFFQLGIPVRNQSVLQRGVNDDVETMLLLIRRLSWINIQPYYVYLHDMVPNVETLRTTLDTANILEREVRGSTAGFNTPTFVCDLMGGGGKRDAHSYEHYDPDTGIAVFRSPQIDPDQIYFHFDPLRELDPIQQSAHRDPARRAGLLERAVDRAGLSSRN
jgi:lysine 2,3-aminomutase